MKIAVIIKGVIGITFVMNEVVNSQSTKAAVVFNIGTSDVTGFLTLTQNESDPRVLYQGTLSNLTPNGLHGFHIHQLGDVKDGCKSTGGHFNPGQRNHGGPKDKVRHVGDLGNIRADSKGNAYFNKVDNKISLIGPNSIIGRAFVIHEKEDDLGKGGNKGSTTTGNAGDRLKCGIIGIA